MKKYKEILSEQLSNRQNQLGKVEVSFMIRCGSFMYNLHTKSSDENVCMLPFGQCVKADIVYQVWTPP